MDLVEVLKDYDWNGSAVGDRKLEQVDYFEEYPVMLWTYLIVIVISTIVGNVGNFLVSDTFIVKISIQAKILYATFYHISNPLFYVQNISLETFAIYLWYTDTFLFLTIKYREN